MGPEGWGEGSGRQAGRGARLEGGEAGLELRDLPTQVPHRRIHRRHPPP